MCSLSIGSNTAPLARTACMNRAPDITSASLLASKTFLPASTAARVGLSPAAPTMAAITASTSDAAATAHNPASPTSTSVDSPAARKPSRRLRAADSSGTTA
ncbi:hypothetical protein D9M68_713570 [compost metagenome]